PSFKKGDSNKLSISVPVDWFAKLRTLLMKLGFRVRTFPESRIQVLRCRECRERLYSCCQSGQRESRARRRICCSQGRNTSAHRLSSERFAGRDETKGEFGKMGKSGLRDPCLRTASYAEASILYLGIKRGS